MSLQDVGDVSGSAGGTAQASAAIIVHRPIPRCAANRRDRLHALAEFAIHLEDPESCAHETIKKPLPRPPGLARGIHQKRGGGGGVGAGKE